VGIKPSKADPIPPTTNTMSVTMTPRRNLFIQGLGKIAVYGTLNAAIGAALKQLDCNFGDKFSRNLNHKEHEGARSNAIKEG
jgi:hypothetical protein